MQVPSIPTLQNLTQDEQQALNVIVQYLNRQDAGLQPWTRLLAIGVQDGSSAQAGQVGEYVTASWSNVTQGSSGNYKQMDTISLTPGDWDVFCYGTFGQVAGGSIGGPNLLYVGTSSSASDGAAGLNIAYGAPPSGGDYSVGIGGLMVRINTASSVTVYALLQTTYTGTAGNSYGTLLARRVR